MIGARRRDHVSFRVMSTEVQSATAELLARDKQNVSNAIGRYTDVAFARGEGSYVWDVDGKRYVDLAAGIATNATGHCHPRIVKAITEQASTLIHAGTPVGYTKPYVDVVEALKATLPAPLSNGKAVLMNSGSEAVEAALKMARMMTKRSMILAFTGSFHGRPMGALAATGSNANYRKGLGALLGGVQHVPYPHCSNCLYGHGPRAPEQCCGVWKAMIQNQLDTILPGDDLAAIIVEPIAGEGGYVIPPPDFLAHLRSICDKTGALLIADEVQTGLGRTGAWWGFESSGVVPDIIAMGKAIGGGLPLGGILATKPLAERWPAGSHGSTFGGNPVACAAGVETIAIIKDENLMQNAATLGAHLKDRLTDEAARLPLIGAVRGKGMMVAADIVSKDGKPLDPKSMKHLMGDITKNGVVLTKCGAASLRFAPALNITQPQIDEALDAIFDVMHELQPVLHA
jgi:4-aminobutyrate aminotransferase